MCVCTSLSVCARVWETRLNKTGLHQTNANKTESRMQSGRGAGQDLMWRGVVVV